MDEQIAQNRPRLRETKTPRVSRSPLRAILASGIDEFVMGSNSAIRDVGKSCSLQMITRDP